MPENKSKLRLYWYPRSRASRAMWLLEESGLDYERVFIDLKNPAAERPAEFRLASPMGKVPALSDGAVHLADSSAIALYLADRYPQAGLAPAADHPDRGRYLYWSIFTPGVIEPAMAERFGKWEVNPQSSGWGNFDLMIRTLEDGLQVGPWILGERFCAADTLLGSSAYFMRLFGLMPESPLINAYLDRCLARPALRAALAADEADL